MTADATQSEQEDTAMRLPAAVAGVTLCLAAAAPGVEPDTPSARVVGAFVDPAESADPAAAPAGEQGAPPPALASLEAPIEFAEAQVTLQTAAADNLALRRRVAQLEGTVKGLGEALAVANAEAEVFRRESAGLRLRLEALGIDAGSADSAKLQQRLLKAVSDLRVTAAQKDRLASQIVLIQETVLRLLQTSEGIDPALRAELEGAMRAANDLLAAPSDAAPAAPAAPATLTDGLVVAVKEELSLVIANLGSSHGVRVGMPFRILRDGAQVASARAVDVRDKISGAIIEELAGPSARVRAGDRLKVDARP